MGNSFFSSQAGRSLAWMCLLFIMLSNGCRTYQTTPNMSQWESFTFPLEAGDTLQITFPGAPNLNTTQKIRVDGKITLPQGDEIQAAAKTPAQLRKEILAIYEPQLQVKEVMVSVTSSLFQVYVGGAVLRQGKITSERRLSALEAIMEAGGFDHAKAKLARVVVVRNLKEGGIRRFFLDLEKLLKGGRADPFYLEANDIVYVPEKKVIF
jgi:polysaccharide export outer membrane protein